MKIAFISADYRLSGQFGKSKVIGGAGYYRCELPAKALYEFGGIETGCFSTACSKPSGEIVPVDDQGRPVDTGWDVVVLQRWMRPEGSETVMRARWAGQTVVQDVDDHFWALHGANIASKQLSQEQLGHYAESLRAASLVTVSTPVLADVIREMGQPNVTVLRNMIDLRNWDRQPVRRKVRMVGWVGTTAHRSGDLEQLGNALRYFCRDHRDVQVIHAGATPAGPKAAKMLRLPVSRVQTRPVAMIGDYPKLWRGLDIALCPLNPVDFNRAKSAIKAMEASAAGVPFVATDLDEYHWYGEGLLAKDGKDFGDRLESMLDFDVRVRLTDSAHERVRAEDVSLRWSDWGAALGALTGAGVG